MLRNLTALGMLSIFSLGAFEDIPEKYCVSYGDPKAKNRIVEYFSFSCPQCLVLFKEDFEGIKKEIIQSGDVYWVFHPTPVDLVSMRAMICLESLSNEEKQVFLESLLPELIGESADTAIISMKKVMELLDKPVPNLGSREFIMGTDAFSDGCHFIKQKDVIKAVPTVKINGTMHDAMPTKRFIAQALKRGD